MLSYIGGALSLHFPIKVQQIHIPIERSYGDGCCLSAVFRSEVGVKELKQAFKGMAVPVCAML